MQGSREEVTGGPACGGIKDCRLLIAFESDMPIGTGEWVRCKAAGSVGPQTYIVWYFEDHARLRTPQIARDRAPHYPPK